MAEVIDDFLKNITAPALNEVNYGAHVGTQFENIDDNFKKIVGTDFLKGIPGDSIILKEVDFTETSWDEILYLKIPRPEGSFHQFRPKDLKESILNAIKYNIGSNLGTWQIENALSTIPKDSNEYDITPISYTESLTYNTKITLICAIDEETGKRYVVSSLPYIFYDARFYNKNISYEVLNDYNDIVDASCVIYFDKNKFSLGEDWGKNVDTVINSLDELKTHCMSAITTFPTLYYDQDTIYDESSNSDGSRMGTFCWKINGHYTGIPANGPKGPKGNSDTGYIVRVSNYSSNKFGATGKKLHPVVSVMIDAGTNENPDVRFVKIDDIINGLDINGNKLYEGVNLQEGALTVAFKSVNDNNYIDVVDNNIQYNVTIKNNDNYRPVNILMDNERWNIIWNFTFNNGLDASEYVEIDGINAKNYITKDQVASSLDKYTFAIKTLCLDTINVSVYPEKVRYSADVEVPNDIYNEDVYGYDGYSTYIDQRLNGYQFSIVYDKEDPVKNIEIDYSDPKMTTPIYKLANPVLYNISISKNGVPCVGDYALKWTFKYFDSVTGESGEIGYNAYEEYAEDYDGTMSNKSTAERLIKSHYNHSSGKWVIENQLDMDIIAEAIPMNYQDKFDPIVIYLTEKKGKNNYNETITYDLAGYDIIDYIKTEYSNYDNDSFVDKCWISPLVQYTYIDSDGKERKEFYVECDDYNSIINTFEAHAMLNYMRSFGKSASNPGLFLPIENYSQEISYVNEEPTLKGHLLFAEKSARKDMIIAPLDNVLKSDSEIKTALSDKDNSLSIWHNDVYIGKHSVEGIENVKGYSNNLHVAGDTEIKKRLNVYGNTNLRNTLYIGNSDDDKLNSYIDVNGNAGFRGVLGVMKNGIFNGLIYANQGIQSANTIYIGTSSDNKHNSYIDVKGNAGLTGSLTVIQKSTFNGPLYANKGVNINSRANINGEVNIVGPVSIEMKYSEDTDGYGDEVNTDTNKQFGLTINTPALFNDNIVFNSRSTFNQKATFFKDVSTYGAFNCLSFPTVNGYEELSHFKINPSKLTIDCIGDFTLKYPEKTVNNNGQYVITYRDVLEIKGNIFKSIHSDAHFKSINTNYWTYDPENPVSSNSIAGHLSIREVNSNILNGETAKPGCLAVENELMVGNDIFVSRYPARRTTEDNKKHFLGTNLACTRITGHQSVNDVIESDFGKVTNIIEPDKESDILGPHKNVQWQLPVNCCNYYCNNGFVISSGPSSTDSDNQIIQSYAGIYIDHTNNDTKNKGPKLVVCTEGNKKEEIYMSDIIKAIKYLKSSNLI